MKKALLSFLITVIVFRSSQLALAQQNGNTKMYWGKIKEAESRIQKIAVTWRRTSTYTPTPDFDVNKSVAFAEAQAKLHNHTPDPQSFRDNLVSMGNAIRDGHTDIATVDFLSDGKIIRNEFLSSMTDSSGKTAHGIDVFDGQNRIYATGFGNDNPVRGVLDRQIDMRLSFCAPGPIRPILLFCWPITSEFPPETTVLAESSNNTVTLEHLLPYKYPLLGKLVLSKDHWRPVELTLENPVNHRVHWRYTLNGYRSNKYGIYFPSEIHEQSINSQGTTISSLVYSLEKVAFNDKVDTSKLNPPVPVGTMMSDFRFGTPGVVYRVSKSIPTDDEIRAFIQSQKDELQKRDTARKRQILLRGLTFGLIGITGSYLVWRFVRRKFGQRS